MINGEKDIGTSIGPTDITLGTAYDINKTLVEKYEKELTQDELNMKIIDVEMYLEKWEDNYFMLLCKERSDYTIFHVKNHTDSLNEMSLVLIEECLKNRGIIKSIEKTEDEYAIEIWLSIEGESFAYYLFPYEAAVIEV